MRAVGLVPPHTSQRLMDRAVLLAGPKSLLRLQQRQQRSKLQSGRMFGAQSAWITRTMLSCWSARRMRRAAAPSCVTPARGTPIATTSTERPPRIPPRIQGQSAVSASSRFSSPAHCAVGQSAIASRTMMRESTWTPRSDRAPWSRVSSGAPTRSWGSMLGWSIQQRGQWR